MRATTTWSPAVNVVANRRLIVANRRLVVANMRLIAQCNPRNYGFGGSTSSERRRKIRATTTKPPPPPRTTTGPWAQGYCRILRGGGVRMSEVPLYRMY